MLDLLRKVWFWLLGVHRPWNIVSAEGWEWYAAAPLQDALFWGVVAVAVVAATLSLLPRGGMPWRTRLTTALLRLAGFALILLLLLQLELRVTVERALRPNVAVVTDRSGTMALKDVGDRSRLDAARTFADALDRKVRGTAETARYDLDWRLTEEDSEAEPGGMTRLMAGLKDLVQRERDLQSVILLTDGNDTADDRGASVAPLYAARGVPVHSVVFGSEKAARMPRVRFSGGGDYVRLGDDLRLEATLDAEAFAGQVVRASLYKQGAEQPVLPPQEGIRLGEKPVALRFTLRPEKAGRDVYRIVVEGIQGAASDKLLVAEHAVDVVDQPIRVLFIDIPRDERKMVGHWLARDPIVDFAGLLRLPKGGWFAQGELKHRNVRGGKGLPEDESDLYEYDVIILGDIPRSYFLEGDPNETRMRWLLDFVKRRGGGLVTLGGRNVYNAGQYAGTSFADILPFVIEREPDAQVKGRFRVVPTQLGFSHPVMLLERDFEGNRTAWFELPKVEGCNKVSGVKPGATLLAEYEKKGGNRPLIACQNVGKGRVLSLAIDTTWRWEMLRPRGSDIDGTPEGPAYFRSFWGNAVRYLAPDPRLEPERPQVSRRQSDASVGQTVTFATRLVDRLYKPIRKADLTVRVTSPSGKTLRIYPADSRSRAGVYEYEVTLDEPGVWNVQALHKEKDVLASIAAAEAEVKKAVAIDDDAEIAAAKQLLAAAKAKIAVEEVRAGDSLTELEDPRAKPRVMASFSESTGGQAYTPEQLDELVESLELESHRLKQSYAVPVWNLPAVMVLLIAIVCLDCLVRKRRGLV